MKGSGPACALIQYAVKNTMYLIKSTIRVYLGSGNARWVGPIISHGERGRRWHQELRIESGSARSAETPSAIHRRMAIPIKNIV